MLPRARELLRGRRIQPGGHRSRSQVSAHCSVTQRIVARIKELCVVLKKTPDSIHRKQPTPLETSQIPTSLMDIKDSPQPLLPVRMRRTWFSDPFIIESRQRRKARGHKEHPRSKRFGEQLAESRMTWQESRRGPVQSPHLLPLGIHMGQNGWQGSSTDSYSSLLHSS